MVPDPHDHRRAIRFHAHGRPQGIISIPGRKGIEGLDFEFDENKSRINKVKHGIDFVEAQAIWRDDSRIEIPARTTDEPRFVVVGMIADKHWSAVMTYRGDGIRLISIRRARTEEVAFYEG